MKAIHDRRQRCSSRMRRVLLLTAALLVLVVAGAAGCGGEGSAPSEGTGSNAEAPIKIGYITPLTGRAAAYGHSQQIAVEMARDEINQDGGVNGHPIELVTIDSPFDPQQAVQAVRELGTDESIFAMIGPFSSAEWETTTPLINQLEVPAINPAVTKGGIEQAPWAFRIAGTDEDSLPTEIEFFKGRFPDAERVVITGDEKEATTANAMEVFEQELTQNGYTVVETVPFETGTTDFAPIVNSIKSSNPDVIAATALLTEGSALAKELDRQGVDVPKMATQHFWAGPFVGVAGSAAEGWHTVGWIDYTRDDPKMQAFVEEFESRAADNNQIPKPVAIGNFPGAYDTMKILADIMEENNITPDTPAEEARTTIRDGFAQIEDYHGLIDGFSMGEDGYAELPYLTFTADTGQQIWVPAE